MSCPVPSAESDPVFASVMRGCVHVVSRCAIAVVPVVVFFLTAPAFAATVEVDTVDSVDVSFLAAPGETNRLVVSADAAGVRFIDTGAVLSTRTCRHISAHEVFCDGLAETLIVETGDGNDTIDLSGAPSGLAVGGPGDDAIVAASSSGEAGNDQLLGLPAAAGQLRGGPGNDTITAGPLGGQLFGGAGNDTLLGAVGPDRIFGGEGPCDACPALGSDDDTIRGGAGDDMISIEEGRDQLDGESGNDSYLVSSRAKGVNATIADSGSDPRDTIALSGCAGVRLSASGGSREKRGRYTFPGGGVSFAGIDGALPCAPRALPRVVGMALTRARRVLTAAGFRIGKITYRRSITVRRGAVIGQQPAAAKRLPVASTVSLIVSSGRG